MVLQEWRPVVGYELRYEVSNLGNVRHIRRKVVLKTHPGNKYGHRYVAFWTPSGKKDLLVHRLVLEAFVGPCPPGMECRHFPDRDPGNNRLDNLQWGTHQENEEDKETHGTRRGWKVSKEGRNNISSALTGRKLSESHKRAIAAAGRGRTHSAETRAKLSRLKLGREGFKGETNPSAKLNADAVRNIRRLKAAGKRNIDLAATFGVSPATIKAIVSRRLWAHV